GAQLDLVVGLGRRQGRVFGLAVKLLQVDAQGAEKEERVLAYGLAGRVGVADPAQTQMILDGTVDEPFAQPAERAPPQAQQALRPPAVEPLPFQLHREGNQLLEKELL